MSARKTRAKKLQELDYVLTNVLDLDKGNIVQLILKELARVNSIEMLLGMSREDLLSFEHAATSGGTPKKINRSKVTLIRAFKGHVWHLTTTGQIIDNDFMKVDPIGFDNFRISDKWTQTVDMDLSAAITTFFGASTTTTSTTTTANQKNKPSKIFKKGIKRDPSLFSVLKGNKD